MALNTKVGNFTQPVANNASFAVTGVGFTPKAIILFATDETVVGVSANRAQYHGMATSTTNRAAISAVHTSASANSDRGHDDTKCFIVLNTSGTTIVAADFVSFDADGFTLNFSTTDLVARKIGYIALGGTDLTNVFIKEFIAAASNTSQAFTGVGFKPDAIILMSAQVSSALGNNISACDTMLSFVDTSLNQFVSDNVTHGSTESVQKAKIISKSSEGGTLTYEGNLTSFDTDGFTINFTITSSVKYCFALCLKGGKYKTAVFNQATGTGNQAVTGVGFQPTGVILQSVNNTTQAGLITTQTRLSFGAASSSTSRASIWNGGGNTGTMDNDFDSGKILNMITEGATPTTNTSADFVSLDSDGFTINNTTADATAREIVYFAVGSNAVAAVNRFQHFALLGVG